MYLKDPKTKKKSATMTILMVTVGVCLLKLLFAGVSYGDFSVGDFSGTDFAAAVGAAGAIYGFRKHTDRGSLDE
jgi:hypothetical protein